MPPELEQRFIAARIEQALGDRSDQAFFLQIGSNDGVHDDPLHELIRRHPGWRGIFVEPVASIFSELRRNYGDDPRFAFLNVAVGRTRGTRKFHYVSETARGSLPSLPDWHSRIGSFSRAHITTLLGPGVEPFIVETDVPTVPLADILTENAVQSVDLLHIDAEGFDYDVLAQLDFARYRPRVILIEHAHLSPLRDHRTRELFQAQGYSCTRLTADYLAIRTPASLQAGVGDTAPTAPEPAVSYSLLLRGGNYDAQVARHLLSVRSLRRLSPKIAIYLHVFSQQLTAGDQETLERLGVTVRHCGSYRSALREIAGDRGADILRRYAPMHKWLALQWIPPDTHASILSLDNDTYILRDLAGLFEIYGHDLCAREEPYSRASPLGYRTPYLDEDTLDGLSREEGFPPVPPFNTGVVIMDGRVAARIAENLGTALQYLWRFNLWMCGHPAEQDARDVLEMRAAGVSGVFPSATALRYPSENRWIKEQVSMWLTVGALGEPVRLMSPSHIAQGHEYRQIDHAGAHPYLVHYYSINENDFMTRWLPDFERGSGRHEPARQPDTD